jgi:hypothetical protein
MDRPLTHTLLAAFLHHDLPLVASGTLGYGYPYGWGMNPLPNIQEEKKDTKEVKNVKRGTFGMKVEAEPEKKAAKKATKRRTFLWGVKSTEEVEEMMDADLLE